MVVYPIVALTDGEVVSPEWVADVTDSINNLVATSVSVASSDSAIVDGSTTSTSFTDTLTTTGMRGVAFAAGASGRALVLFSALGRNGTAGQAIAIDCDVRQGAVIGSGTLFRASDDVTSGVEQNSSAGQNLDMSGFVLLTGLTPGDSYNAVMTYKAVTAGTATINRRNLIVLYVA